MDLICSFLNLKNWPIQTPDLSLKKKNVISKPETAQDTFHPCPSSSVDPTDRYVQIGPKTLGSKTKKKLYELHDL